MIWSSHHGCPTGLSFPLLFFFHSLPSLTLSFSPSLLPSLSSYLLFSLPPLATLLPPLPSFLPSPYLSTLLSPILTHSLPPFSPSFISSPISLPFILLSSSTPIFIPSFFPAFTQFTYPFLSFPPCVSSFSYFLSFFLPFCELIYIDIFTYVLFKLYLCTLIFIFFLSRRAWWSTHSNRGRVSPVKLF